MADGKIDECNILTPQIVTEYNELLSNTIDCLPPDLRETAEVRFGAFFLF